MSRVFTDVALPNNQFLLTPVSAVYNNLFNTAFTLSARVYNQNPTNKLATIFLKQPADPTIFLSVDTGAFASPFVNAVEFGIVRAVANTSSETVGGAVPLNTWVLVTVTYVAGGLASIYINSAEAKYGTPRAAGSGSPSNDTTGGWALGGDGPTAEYNFTGRLAELRIYNVALSPSEIVTLYNGGGPPGNPQPSALVGYWKLPGTASPEPDSSGNGNNAVLSANPPLAGPDPPFGGNRWLGLALDLDSGPSS